MSYISSAINFSQQSNDFTNHSLYSTSVLPIIEGSYSEEGSRYIGDRLLRLSANRVTRVGQLRQQVTIETLPDDVLLKIFKIFLDAEHFLFSTSEKWHTLVHIFRRWRHLAFAYPRHLNLRLLCKLSTKPVKEMMDIWPGLPIYICAMGIFPTKEERDNCIASLRLSRRVSGICLNMTSRTEWKTFLSLVRQPFPALTHLSVQTNAVFPPISRPFLGGSAPSLQAFRLLGVPFPALPELLLSATNLVHLSYENISSSGYISPQAMVTGLSALSRLESLSLVFRSSRDLPDGETRIPPPHMRTLLPALIDLRFRGSPEYLEDIVAQIDARSLERFVITLFHGEIPEILELAKFVCRADKLSVADGAQVIFTPWSITIRLSETSIGVDPKTLELDFLCHKSQFRLPYLVKLCASCFPPPSPLESLLINVQRHSWQDAIDNPDPQWLELLRLFNNVKRLRLAKPVARSVAQALGGLPAERVMEVLPALEFVFMAEFDAFGPVKEAISKFADARQLSGLPVSLRDIRYWKEGDGSSGG